MNLPLRFLERATDERVISVDGAWNQPGLNLSHWPGNATPRELKHDLSTGIALAFARLPDARRRALAEGCVAITNNHFDTDGVCALFAVRHPAQALAREKTLLEAAAAGDLFRLPSERAFQIDQIVGGIGDEERSPWRARFAGLGDAARHELVLNELVARFEEILDGDLGAYADLWSAELERLRTDQARVAVAARDEIAHLDLCVWTADARGAPFDPGRHALFGASEADRILCIGQAAGGTTYRFLIGTTSWFDLVTRRALPRPALESLAARLNELEGTSPGERCAWRCEKTITPSPELWFGGPEKELFAEHADVLAASRLAPAVVRTTILDALRAAWVFPDD